MNLVFRRISEADNVSDFICESAALANYLKKYASRNDRMNIARCILALYKDKIVGYYTTSMREVLKEEFEKKDLRGVPGYPIPVILIGKLAVHSSYQGQGIGKSMLRSIFQAAIKNVNDDGVPAFRAIIVDTKEGAPNAARFYEKYGFKKFSDKPNSLYIPIKIILQTKDAASEK